MLARRFTIVCLLLSLFGMMFAILVAEAEGPARARDVVNRATSARAVPAAETDFHNQFQEVIGA